MEKIATWIWPDRYSDLRLVEFTETEKAYIQNLIVGWSITETGAPQLVQPNGEWLAERVEDEPKLEALMGLFLHHAELDPGGYKMDNPYVSETISADTLEDAFYGLRDKATKEMLLNSSVIQLEVSPTLQRVWNSCHLRAEGIDAKRGFHLKELQQIIDPEKQLSKKELAQEKKRNKGLLFLYLLFFVRNARLELGHYHSYDGYEWKEGKDVEIAVERTSYEWWIHFNSDFFQQISNFVELMSALPKLVKFLAPKGGMDYGQMARIFNLDQMFQYDADNMRRLDIGLEEILLKALDYFPEEKQLSDNPEEFPMILLLVRIYNAQGRFAEAQKLLKENDLDLFTAKQLDFFCSGPDKYTQVAFYESCICKMALTGDYELWRFPQFPKFTEAEFKKFDLHTGVYTEGSETHKLEEEKIKKALEARGTLEVDLREYLHYTYFSDLNLIYEDLEEKGVAGDLDELIAAVVGQINVLGELSYRDSE